MDVRARNNVEIVGQPTGPTLVLAHGFGCDQTLWRRVTGPLGARYRLVLFDHVGSGGSDPAAWDATRYSDLEAYADDVLDLIDGLHLSDVVFVGHSVAAMMGVLAANRRPGAFTKLVLVAPSPRYLDDGDYRGGFTRADIDELLESLESNYLGWARAIAPTIMGVPERPELADELAESFCRTDPACAKVFARATFLSDNRADLPRVRVPTLVLECAHDTIAPAGVGAFVADRIPGAALRTVDTSGHCPQVSAPDATADAIIAFVDGAR
ncbi:alpha/beta hydrolase [Mycolicibacterium duvalii]|uniref:Hydrolase n=1 Tax=Mycolicibacterium duvalii TaxID=39688 RepID=A0A7I7K509_9MYCO|nr:alpha/beta hydrolase [Mycolicibacterium duvalii]MCV7368937.1 alpha/beta hydrolase [Mycolicibacterium duvalii]PEG44424.1 alpha/beta hydrolase [Mycolicibacterium duvalii]BBX19165.1 hydrolase [Mycolicibacterium duvalii]